MKNSLDFNHISSRLDQEFTVILFPVCPSEVEFMSLLIQTNPNIKRHNNSFIWNQFLENLTSLIRLPVCGLKGRFAAELWQLQQRHSEADLHSRPLGGTNAVRHSWVLTQRKNTQRYPWWMPMLFILQWRRSPFLFFSYLAMGLATVEVMQAMHRTWSNSKVRVNGKTRQMQWRDMFDIAVKWRRWGLLNIRRSIATSWRRVSGTIKLHGAKIKRALVGEVVFMPPKVLC